MSETNQTSAESEVVDGAAEAAPETTTPQAELFEVHGKKFNLATPEGKGELKGFLEAMSSELGRKNNEVGTLRKFAAAIKPDSTESDVISKARAKAQEGDVDAAIDAVFGYSKAKIRELEQKQANERENNETWDTYLSTRPELTKVFDKKTIKKVSEADLDIYGAEDPFRVLDAFWMPKTATAQTAAPAPSKKETPPATPSGGQARAATSAAPASKPANAAEKIDLFAAIDEASKPRQRK